MKQVLIVSIALFSITSQAAENVLVSCHTKGVFDAGKLVRITEPAPEKYLLHVSEAWIGGEKDLVTESALRFVARSGREVFVSENFDFRVDPVDSKGWRAGRLITDRKTGKAVRHVMRCWGT